MSINITSFALKSSALLIPAGVSIFKGLKLCKELTKIYNITNDNESQNQKKTNVVYDISIVKLYSRISYILFGIGGVLLIMYGIVISYSTFK